MAKPIGALTAKQRQAVDNYFQNGFNKTKAMIDAGYAVSTAKSRSTDLFNLPQVRAYEEERRASLDSQNIASQTELLEALTKIVRREQEDTEVLPDGQKVKHQIKTSEQIRAIEKMAKYFGMDKIEINQTMTVETLVYGADDDENPTNDEDDDNDYFTV